MLLGWQRPHACVVRLRGESTLPLECQQRALRGNCIAFPQQLVQVTRQRVVPVRSCELAKLVYIMFVGKAKPPRDCASMRGLFAVRHLRQNNEFYRCIDPDPWSEPALAEFVDGEMPSLLYDRMQVVSGDRDVGDGRGYAEGDDDAVDRAGANVVPALSACSRVGACPGM